MVPRPPSFLPPIPEPTQSQSSFRDSFTNGKKNNRKRQGMLWKRPLFFCGLEVYFYELKLLILWDSASIHLAAASAYELLAFTRSVQCLNSPPYRSSLAWSQRLVMSRLGYGRVVPPGGPHVSQSFFCTNEPLSDVNCINSL